MDATLFFVLVQLARIIVEFIFLKVTMETYPVLIDEGNLVNK